jgi:hypothetical protein
MGYTYINVTSCFVVGVSLLVLSIFAVALRTIIRWWTPRKPGDTFWNTRLDDVLCLLSLVPAIGTTVILIYGEELHVCRMSFIVANQSSRRKHRYNREP